MQFDRSSTHAEVFASLTRDVGLTYERVGHGLGLRSRRRNEQQGGGQDRREKRSFHGQLATHSRIQPNRQLDLQGVGAVIFGKARVTTGLRFDSNILGPKLAWCRPLAG